jgi:SAM-dependent methyltransferase
MQHRTNGGRWREHRQIERRGAGPIGRLDARDRQQLRDHYAHLRDPTYANRWSLENPGNRAILEERNEILSHSGPAAETALQPRVLDLGCGAASIVPGVEGSMLIGIDLLLERLVDDNHGDYVGLVNGDGCQLPFANESLDVILLFTVLSSVVALDARESIAAEAARTLRSGGRVIWYDMRYRSPGNRAMAPVSRRSLKRLFPSFRHELRSLTVLPPVARKLGSRTSTIYPMLTRVPFMRSHLGGVLIKP